MYGEKSQRDGFEATLLASDDEEEPEESFQNIDCSSIETEVLHAYHSMISVKDLSPDLEADVEEVVEEFSQRCLANNWLVSDALFPALWSDTSVVSSMRAGRGQKGSDYVSWESQQHRAGKHLAQHMP